MHSEDSRVSVHVSSLFLCWMEADQGSGLLMVSIGAIFDRFIHRCATSNAQLIQQDSFCISQECSYFILWLGSLMHDPK